MNKCIQRAILAQNKKLELKERMDSTRCFMCGKKGVIKLDKEFDGFCSECYDPLCGCMPT